ncbi:MAG: IS66 family transposase zinc-finger binding domain-containing protein [Bacteroidales bacterium]
MKIWYNLSMEKMNITGTDTANISCQEYENLIKTNSALTNENAELKQKINWLEECIKLRNKKIFGSSSEQLSEDQLQINFFNEAENEGNINGEEPEIAEVKSYYRKKTRTHTKDRLPADIEVEIVEHRIESPDDLVCNKCGNTLHEIGSEIVREELKVIPAKAVIVRHIRYAYGCRYCEQNDISSSIVKAEVPKAPIKKSFASPEIIAYIMSQKYVLDIPLYRQEQDFKRRDIYLSRQTMCNWILKASQTLLTPIYDLLHNEF